jgi:hypothetical protein
MSVSFSPRTISHATNAARRSNPMSDKILNQMPQTQSPFARVGPMLPSCHFAARRSKATRRNDIVSLKPLRSRPVKVCVSRKHTCQDCTYHSTRANPMSDEMTVALLKSSSLLRTYVLCCHHNAVIVYVGALLRAPHALSLCLTFAAVSLVVTPCAPRTSVCVSSLRPAHVVCWSPHVPRLLVVVATCLSR